jgi:hypothetical protein
VTREPFSIAALMAIVVIVALDMIVYREIGQLLAIPFFFLAVLTINIGFYRILVRPKSPRKTFLGMVIGGLPAAVFALLYSGSKFRSSFTRPGFIGRQIRSVLIDWNPFLPSDRLSLPAPLVWLSNDRNLILVESAIVDGLGIAMILAGGWLAGRRWRREPDRPPEATVAAPLPLDGIASNSL